MKNFCTGQKRGVINTVKEGKLVSVLRATRKWKSQTKKNERRVPPSKATLNLS